MTRAANLAVFTQSLQLAQTPISLVNTNAVIASGNINLISGNSIVFNTSTSNQTLTLSASGNVGIGTSTVVVGNAAAVYGGNLFVAGNIRLSNTAAQLGGIQFADGTFQSTAGGGGGGGATITTTSTNASFYPTLASTTSGSFTTAYINNNNLYFNPSTGTLSATVFTSLSDINHKTAIQPIQNALDTLDKIEAVAFRWRDTGAQSYGVIAQQVATVLPEIISGDTVKTVNYNALIGWLIQAVKELRELVQPQER